MSLLVDVQEVPWRILDLVRARILANRERKARRQQVSDVRKHTRPRPQQRRMGASMGIYREPEPVPLVLDDLDKIAFAVIQETVLDTKPANTIGFKPGIEIKISNRTASQSVVVTIPGLQEQSPGPFFDGQSGGVLTGEFDPSDGSKPYTSTEQWVQKVGHNIRYKLIPLPCGGESMILLITYTSHYDIVAWWHTIVSTWDDETGQTIVQYGGNGHKSDAYSYYAAVFVGPQSVRRITLPQQALAAVNRIAPDPSTWGTYQQTVIPTYMGPFINSSAVVITTPEPGVSLESAAEGARALVTWGLYRRLSNDGDTTPGVFSFLGAYDPLAANGEEGDSYTYARSEYLQGAPVPGRFLGECVLADSCDLPSSERRTIRFDKTSAIPDNTSTVIPVQSFRPGTRKYALTVGEDDTYIAAWDWGKPAYCRQQLLALGFTEADLSP